MTVVVKVVDSLCGVLNSSERNASDSHLWYIYFSTQISVFEFFFKHIYKSLVGLTRVVIFNRAFQKSFLNQLLFMKFKLNKQQVLFFIFKLLNW